VTLVFVTHQLDQVRNLCDRAVWLDRGEPQTIGDPVRVVDAYLQNVAGTTPAEPPKAEEQTEEKEEKPKDPLEEERWGSGEILLRRVSLVDHRDRELVALGAGTSVAIDIDVDARVMQEDFVFGIGIYHADGTCVYGTNTDLEGFVSKKIEGPARVKFVMPSLDLVAGSYRVDAAVHTRNGRAFDYRRGVLRFVVGSRVHDIGVYRPKHEWRFEGALEVTHIDPMKRNVPPEIAEALKETQKKK